MSRNIDRKNKSGKVMDFFVKKATVVGDTNRTVRIKRIYKGYGNAKLHECMYIIIPYTNLDHFIRKSYISCSSFNKDTITRKIFPVSWCNCDSEKTHNAFCAIRRVETIYTIAQRLRLYHDHDREFWYTGNSHCIKSLHI